MLNIILLDSSIEAQYFKEDEIGDCILKQILHQVEVESKNFVRVDPLMILSFSLENIGELSMAIISMKGVYYFTTKPEFGEEEEQVSYTFPKPLTIRIASHKRYYFLT